MSIFSRVIRIVRANLHAAARRDAAVEGKTYQQYQRKQKRTASNDGPGETSYNSPHDPQLAQYYANLEVPYGSDLETVRRAWKQLLQKYHPDMHSGDPEKQAVANKLVQELNHAYQEIVKTQNQK